MTRIAIVEDEAAVREQLTGYVQRYTRQYGTPFEVSAFASGVEILEEYRPVYDIIFLDVEMPHLDGMETARRIRALDSDVLLIFITNMAQYAIKGYAVGALDYVLKPVPYFAFSQQLQKAVNQLARRVRHYLAVPVDGGMRRLDAAGIYYIESEGHRIHFYTEDGDFSAPVRSKRWRKSWLRSPLPAATAGILSIWHRCPVCSRALCRSARMSCRSAAPRERASLPRWRISSGVRGNVRFTGCTAAVHGTGGDPSRAAICAGTAAPHCKAGVLGHNRRLGDSAGSVFAPDRPCAACVVGACMVTAIAAMYLYLWATREMNLREAGYSCARAFVLAELAASLEWQLHCWLWPQYGGGEIPALLLLAAVYGALYGGLYLFERRRVTAVRPNITASATLMAVVMALTVFAVSNLSFIAEAQATMSVYYIRTLVDIAGVLILSVQHEQLRETALHSELAAMDNVLQRQYEQYRQSKENIRLINRRYHELKMQIAAIRPSGISQAECRSGGDGERHPPL